MSQEYKNWEPLSEIAERLEGVSLRQLSNWESKRDKNGFPEPKDVIGRFKFFDVDEVMRWVHLWRKATKNMGRGKELNSGKR